MKDLKADWRRWTGIERSAAVFIALGMSGLVPALLLFGAGTLHRNPTHGE
jgi:hypothetical protein